MSFMLELSAYARSFRAVMGRSGKIRLTYKPWIFNSLLGPLVWLAITIYSYIGIASAESVRSGFGQFGVSGSITGFLILGQSIFSFFTAMNWRTGMSIERERWYGTLEAVLVTPVNRIVWLMAEAVFGIVDSGWMVFVTFIVASMLFGISLSPAAPLALVVTLALTLLAMIALGIFLAGFYVMTRAAGPLSIAFQAPMRFFTGTSFPVSALPTALQYVSYAIPVTYGLDAVRKALLTGASLGDLSSELSLLFVFTVIVSVAGGLLMRGAEAMAKRSGTLHTF